MARFSTFRDVLGKRESKVTADSPIGATESFIKYQQRWPINEGKDGDEDGSPTKKQKVEPQDAWKEALKQVNDKHVFDSEKYVSVPFVSRKELNEHTRLYTFKHNFKSMSELGLGIGQHIQCAFMLQDGIVERPYAITRPTGADEDDGTIDIIVKTAFPTEKDPGGTVSNIMDKLSADRGDEMLIRGPEGPIIYLGNGAFTVKCGDEETKKVPVKKINFVSGGTGVTPIYVTIRAILETDDADHQDIQVVFIDANPTKDDIIGDDKLLALEKEHDRFKLVHVLDDPPEGWDGETGKVSEEVMKRHLTPPGDGVVTFVCGPPPMLEAAKKGLAGLGFKEDEDFFHY